MAVMPRDPEQLANRMDEVGTGTTQTLGPLALGSGATLTKTTKLNRSLRTRPGTSKEHPMITVQLLPIKRRRPCLAK